MDTLLVVGIAVMAFVLGIMAHQIWVKIVVWHTLREMRQAGIDIEKLLREDEPEVTRDIACRLEQHDGIWFLYNADNNEFVAQGRTRKELDEAVAQRFPDRRVVARDVDEEIRARFVAQADA